MKKHLLLTAMIGTAIFATSNLFAQNEKIVDRGCAAMEYKEMEEKNDPSLKAYRAQLEEAAQLYIENQKTNPTPNAVVTIPVVFHIVYNGTAQNVTDACIAAQLKVINDDYRKLNSDWTKVTQPGWAALVADCEIQFCMAVRDPNGNATNGITRTSTTKTSFGTNNSVKYAAQGGHDVWNRDKYFNIWVCNIGGGILGYAQFPGGAAATDGLVIAYNYMVGSTGCGTAPYNLGRTATHELGHCFGFKHIWGDEAACAADDGVADTPKQADKTFGTFAAGTVKTDACATASPGYMWMNYMDYTDDNAMYMFTAGQKAALAATMNGPRAALKTSNGCTPLTAVEYLYAPESVSVFPNPSNGNVALTVNIPNVSNAEVTVINALGEVVLTKNISELENNNEIKLNMENHVNGMYFIKLNTTEGSITKKMIINK